MKLRITLAALAAACLFGASAQAAPLLATGGIFDGANYGTS